MAERDQIGRALNFTSNADTAGRPHQ